MLPRETSERQLKMLRKLTKGKDIGDLTVDDRLNHNLPNLQYIGNPVDSGIDSYEDFTKKDSKLQTIAFKSKLVNKPLVKENKEKIMEKKLNNVLSISDFEKNWKPEEQKKTKRTEVAKDVLKEYHSPNYKPTPIELSDEEAIDLQYIRKKHQEDKVFNKIDKIQDLERDLEDEDEDDVQPVEDKALESVKEPKVEKEKKQPEFTLLGEEKEPKSNPNFGYAAVRDQEIKKIGAFTNFTKTIDPPTPKERPILNAGQFVHTEKVRGYVNRVEGNKVFVESLDEPMNIVEISLKDAVKPPVEPKETIKKFNEISEELNKEFFKNNK